MNNTWSKTQPPGDFGGIYINLDRDVARRQRIERKIRQLGLESTYRRLSAVNGRQLKKNRLATSVEACFRSHAAAVDLARMAKVPVHVMEDDILLTEHVGPFISHASATGLLDQFDVLFLDMWVDPDWKQIRRYDELYRQASDFGPPDMSALPILDMQEFRVGSNASYVVNQRGALKLQESLQAEIKRGPRMAVDSYIDTLVKSGDLSAGVVVPFLTGIDPAAGSFSNIQVISREQLRLFLLLRAAFFIGADVEGKILPALDAFRTKERYEGLDKICHLIAARPR